MPIIASPYAVYQHATTTSKIIKAALRKIGVIASGDELPAAEFEDALDELNRMLDNWNTENLLIHVSTRNEWSLSSGVDQVEIGAGGSLDTVRPQKIEQADAFIRQNSIEYELDIYDKDRWARIYDKTLTGRPSVLYYERSFPLGLIRLWPKTDQSYDLILYLWTLLSQVSNVNQSLALPPGYADAITHELAIRLAPEYGKSTPPEVSLAAQMSKANVKRINSQIPVLRVDSALTGRGSYNIDSDTFETG